MLSHPFHCPTYDTSILLESNHSVFDIETFAILSLSLGISITSIFEKDLFNLPPFDSLSMVVKQLVLLTCFLYHSYL